MRLLKRKIEKAEIKKRLARFPVTAILGPRQCGKTTLARQFPFDHYFDLENPRDAARLDQPQLALEDLSGLIVIDEIQRAPRLFPLIRYLVDNKPKQKYLVLGSASMDLLQQSSETLAGRIAYFHLGGFRLHDVGKSGVENLWVRGGYPGSFMSESDEQSVLWRENYIATFLERDIPRLGINIPSRTLRRFWGMLSHYHGQVMNYSEFGRSFGISDMTARKYIDILEGAFMVRTLQPWFENTGKRLVKRPKIYIRDSGILHSLIGIENMMQLHIHNKLGTSWEGFAMECVSRALGKADHDIHFWKTHAGAELDLLWRHGGKKWGVEFKYADAPKKSKSMQEAIQDLELSNLWIVYPGNIDYRLSDQITVLALKNLPPWWVYDATT